MALVLGLDGKELALRAAVGLPVTLPSALYLGLLQFAPASMDGMDLATLISGGGATEFSIDPDFYTARKLMTVNLGTTSSAGATASNDAQIQWTNTTGSTQTIRAMFVTDVASGGVGRVLWVGTPGVGAGVIGNGLTATADPAKLVLGID